MKWFRHDTNANMDAKLERLRIHYGMEGYGLYWYILELIGSQVEPHNLTFELEHDSKVIGVRTGIDHERVEEMMMKMVDLGLFENTNGVIKCIKMLTRTDEYIQKVIRSIKKNPDNIRTISGQTPDKVPPNRIEKNRIEENKIHKGENSAKQSTIHSSEDSAMATSLLSEESDNPDEDAVNASHQKRERCPYQKIITMYHEKLPMCPKVQVLSDARKRSIRARWQNGMYGLHRWENYFDHVAESEFLIGKIDPSPGRKQFVADIDFLIRESTIIKTLEGKYHV